MSTTGKYKEGDDRKNTFENCVEKVEDLKEALPSAESIQSDVISEARTYSRGFIQMIDGIMERSKKLGLYTDDPKHLLEKISKEYKIPDEKTGIKKDLEVS